MTEQLVNSILQFHQKLVDNGFSERVLKKLQKQFLIRQVILVVCSLIGLLVGYWGLTSIFRIEWPAFPVMGESVSVVALTLMLMGLFILVLWLLNDEFENI